MNTDFTDISILIRAQSVRARSVRVRMRESGNFSRFPQRVGFPLIQSGDAHRLEEILSANAFRLATLTIAELKLALQGQMDRSLVIQS